MPTFEHDIRIKATDPKELMGHLTSFLDSASTTDRIVGAVPLVDVGPLGFDILNTNVQGECQMALSDANASIEQVEAVMQKQAEYRAALERAEAIEKARVSEPCEYTDPQGTVWRYVVLDGVEIRIESCEPAVSSLHIPEIINGMQVVALNDDACAKHDILEEIYCPDTVLSMGFCVFRECKHLRKIVLPKNLAEFDSGWYRKDEALEELVLSGRMNKLVPSIFDIPNIKRLHIGAGACEIMPGTFSKSKLEEVTVDSDNPSLMTDGTGLYTVDGGLLIALMRPVERYEVLDGCKGIAKKGLSNFECIREVILPQSIAVLDEFAFARTKIKEFKAPESLVKIGAKAFYYCNELTNVELNEGLKIVDDEAFRSCGIEKLLLPKGIANIGRDIAAGTAVTFLGPDATFAIEEDSNPLAFDKISGALYLKNEEGLNLVRVMAPQIQVLQVAAGTKVICDESCLKLQNLCQVVLPEGLEVIGKGAFRDCRNLTSVNLPSTLKRVEEVAFMDTSLERLHIPASLEYAGPQAFVSYGAHHGDVEPSLLEVTVDPGNKRFYKLPGLLCERLDNGGGCVLLFAHETDVVTIPKDIKQVAAYALNGVSGVREMHLWDTLDDIGMCGLAVDCLVDLIHVDLEKPIEGYEFFDIRFPPTRRGSKQMQLVFGSLDHVNLQSIFRHYDTAVVGGCNFAEGDSANLGLYGQVMLILKRLQDPVFLTRVNSQLYDSFIKRHVDEICMEVAKHDDRRAIDTLIDFGYLNEENLMAAIDQVGAVQDAAMTAYLLEVKRTRFGNAGSAIDFEL